MSDLFSNPIYTNTDKILNLVALIAARVDLLTVQSDMEQNPKLRRSNRIRSIHSSLAIENNSLSLEQVTAILDGKRVLGPPQDICEVENAFKAYDRLLDFDPYDATDLLLAHQILMKELVTTPGQFRSGNIGVARGNELVHVAPLASLVSGMMADLIRWTKETDVHPLIKSCVFHYQFEIIHPFQDGNGRMGRMWQTLILYKWKEIFAWLPVETIILERQQEYYRVLGQSNDSGDCTVFIEYMLQAIWDTLESHVRNDQINDQINVQISAAEKQVLLLIIENPHMTLTEVAASISKSVKTAQRCLDSLRKKEIIRRVGSRKDGHWEVVE